MLGIFDISELMHATTDDNQGETPGCASQGSDRNPLQDDNDGHRVAVGGVSHLPKQGFEPTSTVYCSCAIRRLKHLALDTRDSELCDVLKGTDVTAGL